jgi:hypothetical protein
MKTVYRSYVLAVLLTFAFNFVAIPVVLTGCSSTPTASQVAYSTLDGVGATVDAAMKTAAQLRVAGKISAAQWQQIADLHAKFLVSFNAAVDAAALTTNQPVPAALTALAGDVLTLIGTFQGK